MKQTLGPKSLLLGPVPSTVSRVKKRYYYQLIIKYKHEPNLENVLNQILNQSQKNNVKDYLLQSIMNHYILFKRGTDMRYPILIHPNDKLKRVAQPIDVITDETVALLDNLL